MITIVNYGMGNLGSLVNMFKRIGVKAVIQSEPKLIGEATKLVLPGVGAFDAAMDSINDIVGLREVLGQKVIHEKTPVLGVCLGMQLLTNGSEEGKQSGFGWIPGNVKRFPKLDKLKVPHMGWNIAKINNKSKLTNGIGEDPRYYFVHSYCVQVSNPEHSIMRSFHGIDFDSAISLGNIYGVQFHPEKSHRFGMKILKNFVEL